MEELRNSLSGEGRREPETSAPTASPVAPVEEEAEPEPVPDLEAGKATSNAPVLIPNPPQATLTSAPAVDLLDNTLPPQGPGTIDELD